MNACSDAAGVIQLYGMSPPHDCGYCHEKDCSISYGVTASKMSVRAYEALMLIGWRRSGSYFYKPIMHKTCCPAYTIRSGAPTSIACSMATKEAYCAADCAPSSSSHRKSSARWLRGRTPLYTPPPPAAAQTPTPRLQRWSL